MVFQLLHRTGETPEYIEVGGFGSQHGSERGVGRLAVEAGAADAGAGEEVGEWLHSVLRSPLAAAHQRFGGSGGGDAVDIELCGADHPIHVNEAVVGALGGELLGREFVSIAQARGV